MMLLQYTVQDNFSGYVYQLYIHSFVYIISIYMIILPAGGLE